MQKVILLFILLQSAIIIRAQKITIADVKAIATKTTDEVAESLLNKGFEVRPYPQGRDFELKKGGHTLTVNFKDNDPDLNYKLITVCFPTPFNKDFNQLVTQIKAQGKKLSFFYSNYNIYMTEYSIGKNVYVYLCKGFCESEDHKTQYGALFISNQSIQEKLK